MTYECSRSCPVHHEGREGRGARWVVAVVLVVAFCACWLRLVEAYA